MNVAGLERAERPLAARTAVPYWSAYTALARAWPDELWLRVLLRQSVLALNA
jgi:hypothetical protein